MKELEAQNLPEEDRLKMQGKIVEKSCICNGLANGVLKVHHLQGRKDGPGVSVCPGPNIAYFNKSVSLQSMVDHIYGRSNIIDQDDRPNMFIKEFRLYLDYFLDKLSEATEPISNKQQKYFKSFKENLESGLHYYQTLFSNIDEVWKSKALKELRQIEDQLQEILITNKQGLLLQ